ncbi:MAG: serine hydrolase [Saccharofermentanales bacterium]
MENITGQLDGLDESIDSILKEWKVPGAAVAIVKGEKTVYSKGFGVRDLKTGIPADGHTLYRLASSTKSFVAMSLGLLVDEGKLEWDKPLKNYIPDFGLYDDFATQRATARDLLSHRTGVPGHDWAFNGCNLNRKECCERLRYLEPNMDLRVKHQYNNYMYMLAAYLVECITGMVWEELVIKRIFEPLEMKNTFFSLYKARQTGNFSEHYDMVNGEITELTVHFDENHDPDRYSPFGPSGAIVSCTADLINFMILNVNKGVFNGKQIVSEKVLKEMHSPSMVDDWGDTYDEIVNPSCGMGWFVYSYRGCQVASHPGYFATIICVVPKLDIGIIYLPAARLCCHDLVLYSIFDRILGLDRIDWSHKRKPEIVNGKNYLTLAEQSALENNSRNKPAESNEKTAPSLPLPEYAGEYEHPAYMKVNIIFKDGELCFGDRHGSTPLKHKNAETFELTDNGNPIMKFIFQIDGEGNVQSVSAPMEPTVSDIVFVKSKI